MSTLSDLIETTKKLLDAIEAEIHLALTESYSPVPEPKLDVVTSSPVAVTDTPAPATFAESLAAEAPDPSPDVVPEATEPLDTPSTGVVSTDTSLGSEAAPVAPQTHAEALAADAALAAQSADQPATDAPTA